MSRSIIPRLSDSAQKQIREKIGASVPASANKFGAKGVWIDGEYFHSTGEAKRYQELTLLQWGGKIRNLTPHPKFPLVVEGEKVGVYTADASYVDCKSNEVVIEDYKSPATLTEASKLRIKLFTALYKQPVVFVGV